MKRKTTESRQRLENPYAHLNGVGGFDALPALAPAPDDRVRTSRDAQQNPYAILNGIGGFDEGAPNQQRAAQQQVGGSDLSAQASGDRRYASIQDLAREIQVALWKQKSQLWPGGVPSDPVELLDPAKALQMLGFQFDLAESLGQYRSQDGLVEVAGIIDRGRQRVDISRRFPYNTRRFTAAHELGHMLLHKDMRMHRDRPLDGSGAPGVRDEIEKQADKFATFFLMPEKLVRQRFKQFFLCDRFVLTEATLFALDPADSERIQARYRTLRDLARILAGATTYNGKHFRSLADQFKVSVEAMAIRLEELDLIGT